MLAPSPRTTGSATATPKGEALPSRASTLTTRTERTKCASNTSKRWPDAITLNLWTYAIRMANESIHATPWLYNPNKASPNSIFAKSDVQENPKHWYHFGCPVYVTNDQIQQGKRPIGGKWMERAWIGIYLVRSPKHSRNVALVLNIKTARVSP